MSLSHRALSTFLSSCLVASACAAGDWDDGTDPGDEPVPGDELSGATPSGDEAAGAEPTPVEGSPEVKTPGETPDEAPAPEEEAPVEAGDLDEAALADVQLKRALIDRAVSLGKTALADELNLAFERLDLGFRYQSSLARGEDYIPPTPHVACPFLVTPDEAAAQTADCRAVTDRAKVASYGQITSLIADHPLDARYDADRDGNEFWFEQGLMTGISNEAELALRHLRDAGECDQAPSPVQSAFEEGVEAGRRAYIRRLNERLAETGHPMNYPDSVQTMDVCSVDTSFLAPARSRALADLPAVAQAEPLCGPEFVPSTADELARLGDARTRYQAGMEQGVSAEDNLAAERLFRVVPCNVGDPLVLDLDGGGVSLVAAIRGPVFDLFGWGEGVRTAWIGAGEAFLALDRDGNGRIDNGRELFTNFVGTRGYDEVPSGFDHLARHDANGDGRLDAADPAFGDLRLWQDADGDAVSDRGELKTLAEAGVSSIDVRYTAGGALPLPHAATFTRRDGRRGEVRDAFFTHGRALR